MGVVSLEGRRQLMYAPLPRVVDPVTGRWVRTTENGGSKMGMSDSGVSRAVVEDNTTLLLAAVGSFGKEAMGRLRKGSDTSRMLDQEMSARLLHLTCKHDAVRCVRLLLEGGHGITACPVDARDQLTRMPLHVTAETHSASCIGLLLSKNARTDCRLVNGRPLLALEIALRSRRVQVEWSPENSIEDLLAYLLEMDLKAVKLLADIGIGLSDSSCAWNVCIQTVEFGEQSSLLN